MKPHFTPEVEQWGSPFVSAIEIVAAAAEQRDGFARMWMPDADTTDSESDRRRTARTIVAGAIAAMGGIDALREIRTLTYEGTSHKSYGSISKFSHALPGGARLVYDGVGAYVAFAGSPYKLTGRALQEAHRLSRRWDFLSRYLGEGVVIEFAGDVREHGSGLKFRVIRVDDRRFGGLVFRAFFDAKSGLLHHEDYPDAGDTYQVADSLFSREPSTARFYDNYAPVKRAFLWHEVKVIDYKKRLDRQTWVMNYEDIDDSMFEMADLDSIELLPDCCLSQATLWLDVHPPGGARPKAVMPGASDTLTVAQGEAVRSQVQEEFLRILKGQGLFSRLRVGTGLDIAEIPTGDFLLSMVLYDVQIPPYRRRDGSAVPPSRSSPIFKAMLRVGGTKEIIMHDGPKGIYYHMDGPNPIPRLNDLACAKYLLSVFSIDDRKAYAARHEINRIARRTVRKVASAVAQLELGMGDDLLYVRPCCYCDEP